MRNPQPNSAKNGVRAIIIFSMAKGEGSFEYFFKSREWLQSKRRLASFSSPLLNLFPYHKYFQSGLTERDILKRVVEEEPRPEFPTDCNKDMKQLTAWNARPCCRPTFDDIIHKLKEISSPNVIGEIITCPNLCSPCD